VYKMNMSTPKKIMFFITLLGLIFLVVYIFVVFINGLLHFSVGHILNYVGIPFFNIIILFTIDRSKNDYIVETILKKNFSLLLYYFAIVLHCLTYIYLYLETFVYEYSIIFSSYSFIFMSWACLFAFDSIVYYNDKNKL